MRDFCLVAILKTEEEAKHQKGTIADFVADIKQKMDAVANIASEIAANQKGVEDLEQNVLQATEQRKDDHAEYTATGASNKAAVELTNRAGNKMQKFH